VKNDVRERFEHLERRIAALADGMVEFQKDEQMRIATSPYATPMERWDAEWNWFFLSHRGSSPNSTETALWLRSHPKPPVQSPPPRFRVGDWVRHKLSPNTIGRVTGFNASRNDYSVLTNYGVLVEDCYDDRLETWTPRSGEWCMKRCGDDTWLEPFKWLTHCDIRGVIPAPFGSFSAEWFR